MLNLFVYFALVGSIFLYLGIGFAKYEKISRVLGVIGWVLIAVSFIFLVLHHFYLEETPNPPSISAGTPALFFFFNSSFLVPNPRILI